MNRLSLSTLCLFLVGVIAVPPAHAEAQGQIVIPGGSNPSATAPKQNFTGHVRVDPAFDTQAPQRVYGSYVTFEPGARTAWHTHPLGQALIIISGMGLVQSEGGPIEEVRPGDTVWFPPHVRHWHGAAPHTSMTHIAVAEEENGTAVDWREKVTDAQYAGQ